MTDLIKAVISVTLFIFSAAGVANAQVSIKMPGQEITVGKESNVNIRGKGGTAIATEGSSASVTVGSIDADADIQGVTVINGRVSIDGKDVPPHVTRYKSPKTGTVYLIQRKGSNVSVTTEEGGKK